MDHPEYLRVLINYIHNNPVHHRYRDRPEEWPYSSYDAFLSLKRTKLQRKEVLGWLGGEAAFRKFHESQVLPFDQSILLE